jgi:hypothetical protein
MNTINKKEQEQREARRVFNGMFDTLVCALVFLALLTLAAACGSIAGMAASVFTLPIGLGVCSYRDEKRQKKEGEK